MRKIILTLFAVALSVAAWSQDKAVRHIGTKEFIENVSDITKPWDFRGDKPAIVDFYATWCGPCKALGPVLEKVAAEFEGKVDVYKVDVDESGDVAQAFNIRSIPTIMFIDADGKVSRHTGFMNEDKLREKFMELAGK